VSVVLVFWGRVCLFCIVFVFFLCVCLQVRPLVTSCSSVFFFVRFFFACLLPALRFLVVMSTHRDIRHLSPCRAGRRRVTMIQFPCSVLFFGFFETHLYRSETFLFLFRREEADFLLFLPLETFCLLLNFWPSFWFVFILPPPTTTLASRLPRLYLSHKQPPMGV